MNLQARFKQFDKEYLGFDKVEPKLASRPDLHAFILLNKLVPHTQEIIAAAEHDVIYLDVDMVKFGLIVTDDHILELVRCGIIWDAPSRGLRMLV